MVGATLTELAGAGIEQLPEAVAADAGYWNEQHMDEVTANKQIPVLIPPDKGSRGTPRPGWIGGRYAWMRNVLATEHGRRLYRKRKQTVEPLSATPNTTAACTGFTAGAGSRCAPSGDY